uniref:Aminotransferase-like plant mobile domain-containing protein n=1 Tax=Fagus sylvatica TaxID=28930 RepID=A0A2N9ED66_FAGSY
MASSSSRSTRGRGETSSGEGGPSVAGKAMVPRDSGDNGGSSSSDLGSLEPLGDILGRPTVDPWYRSGERFPSVPVSLQPPSADWEWLVIREDAAADVAWTPNFREIRDLQIQRNEMLTVPLVFDFQCSRAIEWADWVDSKLANREFCDRLEQAGVLRSILISRCSSMYHDTEALRQLVRRWCPSTHTFFFAHGEMTVTLEDIENHWLLPILGDQDPAELELSPEELKIEAALANYIGRMNIALGTQAARFNPWMELFNREDDASIRRAAFVAYWLSKCIFGEHPTYSIKPLYFSLAVKIAARVCFPLALLLLGQLYIQLDLLHAEELVRESCHIVTTALNSSIVHTFLWEHALEYIRKGRKPYEARKKFASIPEAVAAHVGDFQGDSKVCWRPYGVTHRGFSYESVMSGFRNVEAQDYTLIAGDVGSLTYLSATNASWLPVLSSGGFQFTAYSAHRVKRQFGFNEEVPAVMGIAVGEILIINPFLKARAFAYWSGIAPRVIVPSGDRVDVYTTGMSNYWRELMAAMVEFRNSGRGDISHLLESYTSPLPHPRLFVAINTMTTYANRQSLGYAVWYHEDSRWVIYDNHHPPLWLRDHPHIPTPGKVPSNSGRRTASAGTPAAKRKQSSKSKKRETPSKDSPAQVSKKKKTRASAPVIKKPVRKTRAGKRTFIPPAFPSAPSSIAARIAARKSTRSVVYSEKRSKQRADTDDLDSSLSSSSDKGDPSGAAAERTESEDAKIAAAEIVSDARDFAAEASSADKSSTSSTSSGEEGMVSRASTEEDEVSMDELRVAEAAFDSDSTASASKPRSAEETVEGHVTVGVVTSARELLRTPITITSSGGTVQGDPSGGGNHVDPSLLDSSPSTRHYPIWEATFAQKILSGPLQFGPRAKTLRQEVHFSYHMQLSDHQELLRSSRNLSQKMTPWHKEHSNGLRSQDHILRTQARLCARPSLPDSQQVDPQARVRWKEDTLMHDVELSDRQDLSGRVRNPDRKTALKRTKNTPVASGRGTISHKSKLGFPRIRNLARSRQRKLSDAAFARRVFPARNKLIYEPGCVGKITTPATSWNSRFAESIPHLIGIFTGKVHENSSNAPTSGSHNSLIRTPIHANFVPLERGRRELSGDMLHDPF